MLQCHVCSLVCLIEVLEALTVADQKGFQLLAYDIAPRQDIFNSYKPGRLSSTANFHHIVDFLSSNFASIISLSGVSCTSSAAFTSALAGFTFTLCTVFINCSLRQQTMPEAADFVKKGG